ncbi:hypothetical protein ACI6Q2_16010 [Chitinophagaceae bacterium LWZ2-11]
MLNDELALHDGAGAALPLKKSSANAAENRAYITYTTPINHCNHEDFIPSGYIAFL